MLRKLLKHDVGSCDSIDLKGICGIKVLNLRGKKESVENTTSTCSLRKVSTNGIS